MTRLPTPKNTLKRTHLRTAVHQTLPQLSYKQSQQLVDHFIEEIFLAIVSGENVKLRGFGTFYIRDKKQRIGRNPKTKEDAIVTPRRVVKFKSAAKLVAKINGTPYDNLLDKDED